MGVASDGRFGVVPLESGACGPCVGARFRRYRRELVELPPSPGTPLATVYAAKRCPRPAWPEVVPPQFGPRGGWNSSIARYRSRGPTCAVGQFVEFVLCSQALLVQRDPAGALKFLTLANALMPEAAPCLQAGEWPLQASEFYSNYRRVVRILGEEIAPTEEEDENKGFFAKAFTEAEWADRVSSVDGVREKLYWKSRLDTDSEASDFESRRAMFSSAAPPGSAANKESASLDAPCGMRSGSGKSSASRGRTRYHSTARQLSSSGCVWLLENACIDERRVVLFAQPGDTHRLPQKLRGCGEFGNYEFNAVEVEHPRALLRLLRQSKASMYDTLLVIPGLLSSVSATNPFHLLHSTVPVAWQLHHSSYGLCVPRSALDIRLAFINAHHARRMAHFWRIFSSIRPVSNSGLNQRFAFAASSRFWWGPLAERPPMPLGADSRPRCYRRLVFGRELLRTGIGGFATPRVFDFYRRYVTTTMAAMGTVPADERMLVPDWAPNAYAEWGVYEQMRPDLAPGNLSDPNALGEFASPTFTAPYFATMDGDVVRASRLAATPVRTFRLDEEDQPGVRKLEDAARLVRGQAPTELAERRVQVNVLLIQRREGTGRWIANLEEVLQWVAGWQHPVAQLELIVADFEQLHPAAQWNIAQQAHMLIAVTGAALAWLAFLPHGGVVLDIFPPRSNFCNEGWERNPASHYGGLARLASVVHACMVHPAELQGEAAERAALGGPEQRAHEERRDVRERLGGLWHGQDVRLDIPLFKRYFAEAVERALLVASRASSPGEF